MILYNGLLDYTTPWPMDNVRIFTGNPIVKKNGAVVMGAGAAKVVRDAYKGIDVYFGKGMTTSTLLKFVYTDNGYMGWAKVKNHWQMPADLGVVASMVEVLTEVATKRPDMIFHMNYPAVGNGKLKREDVEPLLVGLPDNVCLYIKEQ